MSCQHAEDVCQQCLEKVQTEEAPQKKKSQPGKTITEKRNRILIDSAILGVVGYLAFYNAKFFLGTVDYGLSVVKDILRNLLDRHSNRIILF